jgi:hypothetical protein
MRDVGVLRDIGSTTEAPNELKTEGAREGGWSKGLVV